MTLEEAFALIVDAELRVHGVYQGDPKQGRREAPWNVRLIGTTEYGKRTGFERDLYGYGGGATLVEAIEYAIKDANSKRFWEPTRSAPTPDHLPKPEPRLNAAQLADLL